ncbi:MAG TPA: HlyD family secretion protein [Acetobacteraceae bacterium]|nr:HlyD family secretion protein [Acetobacteraceae bacterium]
MADATTTDKLPESGSRQRDIARSGFIRRERRRLALRYGLIGFGAILLIVGGLIYWLSGGRYVTTEDAYVQANVLNVTTDVSGLVDQIMVREGETVQQGQVLFRLDPTEFQIAIDQAQANLGQTELQLRSLQADYVTAEKQAAAQQAKVDADQATFDRYAELVKQNAVARQQYDDAKYQLAADQAAFGASQAGARSALARLGSKADAPIETMPAYKLAAAKLADAQRAYRHSVVRAAFAGQVTQVNKLQPGQYLAAGTPAFGLVDTQHMWIAAEPKETALTYARPGQPATITIDTYPNHVWHGALESRAPATDQEFALLPAQNSSGNWVKVVQRVPLRVAIQSGPGDPPLSAGMSAEVSIDTHHERSLGDLF